MEIDRESWGTFLASHQDRLRRMVALRLDERLRGRIDPSDVVQEAFLEAVERRPAYEREADPMPPFLWLRFLTLQRLQTTHRRHLGTRARDAGREVANQAMFAPAASSAALAAQLLGRDTRASEAAIRAERRRKRGQELRAIQPAGVPDRLYRLCGAPGTGCEAGTGPSPGGGSRAAAGEKTFQGSA
jgi:RNA polymerase sigma-70 factor (ECF subfamily)